MKKGIYQHFKGKKYELLDIAFHSETLEKMVVYRALYGEYGIWVRPLSMWRETVEQDGKIVPRFRYVGNEITIERSCGAMIYRRNRDQIEYLLLFQRGSGTWSFPKGHMEAGESRFQTAAREVFEETSLQLGFPEDFFEHVTYTLENGNVKYVYLFLAEANGDIKIKPDEIESYKWLSKEEATLLLPNVGYQEVLNSAEKFLEDKTGVPNGMREQQQ